MILIFPEAMTNYLVIYINTGSMAPNEDCLKSFLTDAIVITLCILLGIHFD